MKRSRRSAYRRTRYAAVGVCGATLLTFFVTSPGGAQDATVPFDAGTGTAIAIGIRANPVFGNLSFGITAGESVAGHQNTGATGQSKAVNLGVIGVTLAGEGCEGAEPTLAEEDRPQPVIVNSDEPGATEGKSATEAGVIEMRAMANKAPYSEAITEVAPLGDPALALITAGRTTATSGVVAEGVREARAVTEIASVRLLDGLVTLGNLRWEAVQRTGAEEVAEGTFSLGSLNVAGQEIPLPENDIEKLLALLDDTLAALGLAIELPEFRFEQGIVFVDPLSIGIVPADLRDGLIAEILRQLHPVRVGLTELLFDLGCGGTLDLLGNNAATAVTVLDLALGAISGAGSLTVELGGVQATTAAISGFEGLGDGPQLPDLQPTSPNVSDIPSFDPPDLANRPVVSPPAVETPDTGAQPSTPDVPSTDAIADVDGDRGGALLGVGAAGLLLLLATAEGDRRKMRRAQREIPLEV